MATGGNFSHFVKSDGSLWAMGGNDSGQLGDGTTIQRTTPVQITTGTKAVADGQSHALYLKTDGTLWATGYNSAGQLGDGTTTQRNTPVQVASNVTAMTAGRLHSLYLKSDGSLWGTGSNNYGQLGAAPSTVSSRSTPVQITTGVSRVAVGFDADHALFIRTDGTLWGMGRNEVGQLGDGSGTNQSTPVQIATGVAVAAASIWHSLYVKTDGTLWAMGSNYWGELGDGTSTDRHRPVQIATGVTRVATGTAFSLFVKNDGTLWTMGINSGGQLGDGGKSPRYTPVQVAGGVMEIAAGDHQSLYIGASAVGAPTIATQPASQTVTAGASVTFNVVASGATPSYQWSRSGTAISGATGATLTLGNVQTANAGSYTVVVTNSAGTVTSNAATLTVNAAAVAPTITTPPQAQTLTAGAGATFTVVATGTPPPTYQWRKNGVAIGGATGAALTLGNVQAGDAGSYTVVVRNSAGSVTSSAATLTVNGGSAAPLVLTPPLNQTITVGGTATFSVAASGLALGYQWFRNGVVLTGATNATFTITTVGQANAGSYTATVTNGAGSITCDAGVLTITTGPAISTQPLGQHVDLGERVSLNVLAAATGGGAFTYQWKKNGTAIAGAIGSTFTIPSVVFDDMGFYSVSVGSGGNTTEADAATLTVATGGSARPVNISARAMVPANGDLTPGFVIAGAENKTVLVRAVGPGLTQFGVPDVLADPQLVVIPLGSSTVVASNNDWGSNANLAALNAATTSSGAFALPVNSRDAATVATLAPGPYTVRVTGAGSSSGVALVEVYDTEPATTMSRFVNLSARASVGTGANLLVPGFVVAGDSARLLLIRATGPGLGQFGVTDVLADPQLKVIPLGRDFSVVGNDNWGGTTALKAAFAAAGAFSIADNSRDAAVLLRLPPGGYTVMVSGVADTTGVALVEVYDLGP